MQCEEVIRELAVPTTDRDRSAVADHLAGCTACAGWARRGEAFDRAWEATRPAEPSSEAWDAVWAGIAQALPGPSPVRVLPLAAASRRRGRVWQVAAVAVVGLAQAAAILVALGLAWQTPTAVERPVVESPAVPVAVRSAKPVEFRAELDASCLMVIHLDESSGRIEDMTPPEMNLSSDVGMIITNQMEWLATPRMAAQ